MEAMQKLHSLTGAGASVSAPVVKHRDPAQSRPMSLVDAAVIVQATEEDPERFDEAWEEWRR